MEQTENIQTDNVKHSDTRSLMVSISCITYNHAPYIRQCLEGFVMQKTNFRFEAIVHDDASTDGTATIIREYAEKYPDIIKPIYETENQYSKHDGSLGRIMDAACTGIYIACCEGDDYWTDPNKLQRQVDFLEAHPDYSMCFHGAIEHWENGSKKEVVFSEIDDREYSGIEIFENWIVPTASVVLRSSVLNSRIYQKAIRNKKFIYGDIRLFLSCCACGKVYGMSNVMSVYRRHEGSAVFGYSVERQIKHAYHSLEIYKVFGNQYKKLSKEKFYTHGMGAFLYAKAEGHINYRLLLDLVKFTPVSIISWVYKRLKNRI